MLWLFLRSEFNATTCMDKMYSMITFSFRIWNRGIGMEWWFQLFSVFCIKKTFQIGPGLSDFLATCLRLWYTLDYRPAPRSSATKRVPGHIEAWIRVTDKYPTRITVLRFLIESGANIWSSIECEPMPSWPVVECARLWCGRLSLIVEVGYVGGYIL